jgi:hypothetical protein
MVEGIRNVITSQIGRFEFKHMSHDVRLCQASLNIVVVQFSKFKFRIILLASCIAIERYIFQHGYQ